MKGFLLPGVLAGGVVSGGVQQKVSTNSEVMKTNTSTIRLIYPQWQGGNVAAMVPEARIFALIVPCVTCCVATSGREAFMIVLEKKVRTSRIARKMIAAVLTHSRLLTFVSSMVNILSRCG